MVEFRNRIVNELVTVVKDVGFPRAQASMAGLGKNTFTASARFKQFVGIFREFNMKALGALFLAQGISNALGGLIRRNRVLAPIFEAMATLIDVALLPAFLPLALVLLKLSGIFASLPKPIRWVIGAGIIVGFVFFKIIAIFAQLVLGIAGVIFILTELGWLVGTVAWFTKNWRITLEILRGVLPAVRAGLTGMWSSLTSLVTPFTAVLALVGLFVLGIKSFLTPGKALKGLMMSLAAVAGIVAIAFGAPLLPVLAIVAGALLLLKVLGMILKHFGLLQPFVDFAENMSQKVKGWFGFGGENKTNIPVAPGVGANARELEGLQTNTGTNVLNVENNIEVGMNRDEMMDAIMRETSSQVDRSGGF